MAGTQALAENLCLKVYQASSKAQAILTRQDLVNATLVDSQIANAIFSQKPGTELESFLVGFEKLRVDQGHVSWRKGFQDGIANDNKETEAKNKELVLAGRANEVAKLTSLLKPRPKPVPPKPADGVSAVLAQFNVSTVEQLTMLSGAARAAFEQSGYTVNPTESNGVKSFSLEQDINRAPKELNPALNLKLNGVHKKYAQIVSDYLKGLHTNRQSPNILDMQYLSAGIHEIWMNDASWKVEGIFKKYLNVADFYSIGSAERIEKSAQILAAFKTQLSVDDTLALQQFRHYADLSEGDKRLDDQILFDIFNELRVQASDKTK